jgi:hypothetical protein
VATRAVVGSVNTIVVSGGATSGSGGGGGSRGSRGGGGASIRDVSQTGGVVRGGRSTSPPAIISCIQKINPAVTHAPAPIAVV